MFLDGGSMGRTKLGAVPYALETSHAVTADSATSAGAISAAALRVAPGDSSYTTNAGATDCSCAAGEIVVGGGTCVGHNCNAGLSLVESRPLTATTWRVSCENGNGSRVQCPSPTISCLKSP